MQYVLGLGRLGHEVDLFEPIHDPSPEVIEYFDATCRWFGVGGRIVSPSQRLTTFDLVLNLSGLLTEDAIDSIPIRVYVDLDPGFNQVWQAQGVDRRFDGHTHFATVGQCVGTSDCDVPTAGRTWIHVLPPVVLERWMPDDRIRTDAFTTVANLRSYGPVEHNGVLFGQKIHSLRKLRELPRRVGHRFVLAAATHPDENADVTALTSAGWEFVDPVASAGTPAAYREFVSGSRAEIGIAKSGYVVSRSGWFSDRSACYLASGRPVVAQDAGFSSVLPVGAGLLSFHDEESAAEAAAQVVADYDRHSRCARDIAREWFDSDRVLGALIDSVAG
jgi:hypothetical protein